MTVHQSHHSRPARTRLASSMIALVLAVGIGTLGAQSALAYNPSAAAAYADQWALGFNTPTYPLPPNDCTNFVSQALRVGGYPVQSGDRNSYHSW